MIDVPPENEARLVGDDLVECAAPKLSGIECEVQYGLRSGKPIADLPGTVAFGTIVLPTGQPRVIVQISHPDGTSLAGIVRGRAEFATLAECLRDAGLQAQTIADDVDRAPRQ